MIALGGKQAEEILVNAFPCLKGVAVAPLLDYMGVQICLNELDIISLPPCSLRENLMPEYEEALKWRNDGN